MVDKVFDPDAYLSSSTSNTQPAEGFNPDSYLGVQQEQVSPEQQGRTAAQELGRQVGLTGRYLVRGASAIPNAVADFGAGAFNLVSGLAGSDKRLPYLSQTQEQGLEKTFPSPETGLEKGVQVATEAGFGAMFPGVKTPALSTADKTTMAGKEAARRAAAEVAGSAAGAVAGEKAAEAATEYTGSPWAGLAAGLATGTLVGSGTGKTLFALSGPRSQPTTIQEVRNRASRGYTAMEDAGVAINKQALENKLFPAFNKVAVEENLNPKTVSEHRVITEQLDNAREALSNPFSSFTKLEQVRSNFSTLAQNNDNTGRIAKKIVNEIDSYLGGLDPKDTISVQGKTTAEAMKALKEARTDWRNQARAQILQDVLESATARVEGATGATGDFVRKGLVNLTANTEKMKMFSTREQNVIKASAKATDLETILSTLAKFNPERGALQANITAGALYNLDKPAGQVAMATALGGLGADKALAATRKREMNNLISQIASGNLQAPKEGFAIPGLFGASQGVTRNFQGQ